jgi:hypothetical protein
MSKDYYHFLVDMEHGPERMTRAGEYLLPYLMRMAQTDPSHQALVTNFTGRMHDLSESIMPIGYRSASGSSLSIVVPPATAEVSINMAKIRSGAYFESPVPLATILPRLLQLQRDILIPGRVSEQEQKPENTRIGNWTRALDMGPGVKIGLVNVSSHDAIVTYKYNYVSHVDGLPRDHAERFRGLHGDHNNPWPVENYDENLRVAPALAA